jgi:hypothetical protein
VQGGDEEAEPGSEEEEDPDDDEVGEVSWPAGLLALCLAG